MRERPKLRVEPEGAPPQRVATVPVVQTGDGDTARDGDLAVIRYTATTWRKAKEFDATWDRGDVFPFVVGSKGVMDGINEGVRGMHAGERKLVVIPPAAGYRSIGMPGEVSSKETLVFVVDLVKLQRGKRVYDLELKEEPGVAGGRDMKPGHKHKWLRQHKGRGPR